MSQSKNLELFPVRNLQAYGGELRKKAKNRGARALVAKSGSMHITLRSTQATGAHSFQHLSKRNKVKDFAYKFSMQNDRHSMRH